MTTNPTTFTGNTEEFNSSLNAITAAAWASGGALNQSRYGLGGVGTQTAFIAFGGRVSPPNSIVDDTETYNGTSFTEVNDLGTARFSLGSAGTQTAALDFG